MGNKRESQRTTGVMAEVFDLSSDGLLKGAVLDVDGLLTRQFPEKKPR
jgi:hypothetical protein